MRKQELRTRVLDRMPTEYPRSVGDVLVKIIDLTNVENWKTDDVENFWSKPRTETQLAFLTRLDRHTVHRALKVLLQDGLIKPSTQERNSYRVEVDAVLRLRSRYADRHTKHMEEKIMNADRMRFSRWDGLTGTFFPWRAVHPVPCTCAGFCSHPSTI